MNLAIVIAVSNYSNPSNNLPASKKDGEIISGILSNSKKFDEILSIFDNEPSLKIKEILSNFFSKHKGEKINELFFYYSGHGEFSNDEFYYLLSDFDRKRKNQSSLQNSEVDDLIRTLNPEIVVKVIDACQSGTSYIKENDVLNKYFNDTKRGFNKCYFLNSSLSNQSSYQDDNLSFFTYSFVQSLKEHPSTEIRYKDIIDFILDEFDDNPDQTPFFVIQAELTEKFCALNENLKQYLIDFNLDGTSSDQSSKSPPTLLELVQKNAKEYVDKEGTLKAIEFCKLQFQKLKLDKEIGELFNLEIDFIDDNNTLPGVKAIGKWLKDNNNDFFAVPYYEEYYDHEYTGDTITTLTGYQLRIKETPFKAISIDILSKYPNLKSYKCNVAFLPSRNQISFFYVILNYIENVWDDKTLDLDKIKWSYTNKKIAFEESISEGVKGIAMAINDKIRSDLNIQFGLKNEDNIDDDLPF